MKFNGFRVENVCNMILFMLGVLWQRYSSDVALSAPELIISWRQRVNIDRLLSIRTFAIRIFVFWVCVSAKGLVDANRLGCGVVCSSFCQL